MGVKQSLVLYHDIRGPLEMLSDQERGKLFLAILDYSEHGVVPDFTGALQMAFAFIQTGIDRDAEKWADKVQKRSDAGRLGGFAKAANMANASFAKQNQQNVANLAVPVPVPVPVPAPVPGPAPVQREKGDKSPLRSRFSPPSYEDVVAYCAERGGKVDPQRWYDFYLSNGWKVGKNPMRDWKAAVRSWERNSIGAKSRGPNGIELADNDDHTLDGIL